MTNTIEWYADEADRLREKCKRLSRLVAAKDAEISALKKELEQQMPHRVRLSSDLAEAVEVLRERDSEIARLRKVVEAVKKLNAAKNGKDTMAAWEDIDDAMDELVSHHG